MANWERSEAHTVADGLTATEVTYDAAGNTTRLADMVFGYDGAGRHVRTTYDDGFAWNRRGLVTHRGEVGVGLVLSLIGRIVLVLAVGVATVVALYWDRLLSAGLFGGLEQGSSGSLFHADLRLLALLPLAVVALPTRRKGTIVLPWVAAIWFAVAAVFTHQSVSIAGLSWWTYTIEIVLVAGYVATAAVALGLIVAGRRRLGAAIGATLSVVGLAVALAPGGGAFEAAIWAAVLILAIVVALLPSRAVTA